MPYQMLFPKAVAQTVNSNWNSTTPRQPVRGLQYLVYQCNFMKAQYIVNSYRYKL